MPIQKGKYPVCLGCIKDGWQKGLHCSGCNRNPVVLEKLVDLYEKEVDYKSKKIDNGKLKQ